MLFHFPLEILSGTSAVCSVIILTNIALKLSPFHFKEPLCMVSVAQTTYTVVKPYSSSSSSSLLTDTFEIDKAQNSQTYQYNLSISDNIQ